VKDNVLEMIPYLYYDMQHKTTIVYYY